MGLIRFRCSDELEERFEAAAKRADLTFAQLGRTILERAFPEAKSGSDHAEEAQEGDNEYEGRSEKVTTRLTRSENAALGVRAKAFGMGKPTFVMRLIRAHLAKQPELTFDEVKALREATRELSYIGRNLNQVAHGLNINLHARDKASAELIAEINDKVDSIRSHIKKVLDRNINRWGI